MKRIIKKIIEKIDLLEDLKTCKSHPLLLLLAQFIRTQYCLKSPELSYR